MTSCPSRKKEIHKEIHLRGLEHDWSTVDRQAIVHAIRVRDTRSPSRQGERIVAAALITGGARRIGRALALALAEQGWDLAIHYRTSSADAQKTVDDAQALGVSATMFEGDLGDPATIESLVDSAYASFPELRLLINNASLFPAGALADTTLEQWDRVMDVNLRAPFVLTQHFARAVESGSVINLLDAAVNRGRTSFVAYSVSKAGLELLTRVAARELAPSIRVNAIAPGPVLPPPGKDEEHLKNVARRTPLGTPVATEDIVAAMRYLVETESVTGHVMYVDGGEHLVGGSPLGGSP